MNKKSTRIVRAKSKSKVSRSAARKAVNSWLVNIYKAGTKKYYRDALQIIFALTVNYDGFNTVKGLKSLIDDIQETANNTLEHKKLYLELRKGDNHE